MIWPDLGGHLLHVAGDLAEQRTGDWMAWSTPFEDAGRGGLLEPGHPGLQVS